jgi:hypothetical protein
MRIRAFALLLAPGFALLAQQPEAAPPAPPEAPAYVIPAGTKIPLGLINSISTKSAAEGDRVYLETVFPILSKGKIVIPPGSYVIGTVTQSKRPGRMKGRGELFVRFDTLTLPNGVTRDFRSRIGSLDGRATEELNREEGKIRSDSNKGGDARTVGEGAAIGASVGAIAGSAAGHAGMGAGLGAAAGATAGLVGVLMSRGPDAMLTKGTTLEMILDRQLEFGDQDINFNNIGQARDFSNGPGPVQQDKNKGIIPRRYPINQ